MKKIALCFAFLLTFTFGYFAGHITSVSAAPPVQRLVGGDGYLSGWSVTVNGDEVCSDPYVWSSIKEIDCN